MIIFEYFYWKSWETHEWYIYYHMIKYNRNFERLIWYIHTYITLDDYTIFFSLSNKQINWYITKNKIN